jgi:hypothetical protein
VSDEPDRFRGARFWDQTFPKMELNFPQWRTKNQYLTGKSNKSRMQSPFTCQSCPLKQSQLNPLIGAPVFLQSLDKEVDMVRSMKISLVSVTVMMSIVLALSAVALGGNRDGRGRGKEERAKRFFNADFDDRDDRRRRRDRNRDRKADKFINGHDARDGRFDGRGPRERDRGDGWRYRDSRRMDDDFNRREFRTPRRFRRPVRRF